MEILGIILLSAMSLWAILVGFTSCFFAYGMTGQLIKSGAVIGLLIGCVGVYGVYYILTDVLLIQITLSKG